MQLTQLILSIFGSEKSRVFQIYLDRIQPKLATWNARTLSWVRRGYICQLILCWAVLSMSVFEIPMSICNKIDHQITRYFLLESVIQMVITVPQYQCSETLEKGLLKKVGNGLDINLWFHPLVPRNRRKYFM